MTCSRVRRRPYQACAVAACLSLVPAARAASAVESASPPTTRDHHADARERYRAGVNAYRDGRYKDAIDLFLEADRLSPSAALSFNVARAYEKIRDSSNALRWYRDYLRRAEHPEDEDQVRRLVDSLEERLHARGVQQMTVLSDPPGATVVVDGHPVGVTPWTSDLAPGPHHVAWRLPGYADEERTVDLSASDALDVSIALTRAEGRGAASLAQPGDAPPPAHRFVEHDAAPAGRSSSSLVPWGWAALGTGTAAIGGAVVFEILRRNAEDDARKDPTQVGFAESFDTMENRKTAARVLGATGAALVITGGVLLIVGKKKEGAPPDGVAVGCGSHGCGAAVTGRF